MAAAAAAPATKDAALNEIKKATSDSSPYVLVHKRVRNDDHCPICRIYYVSIHKTVEDAMKLLETESIESDDLTNLKKGYRVWVDEWVRRSNGDRYQIFKATANKIYDDAASLNEAEPDDEAKDTELGYMLLQINVKKFEYCPDNISYKISFHNTLDAAWEIASEDLAADN
ncbi:MAG: hypothetical protein Hyperionvirus3_143 [Hyperionvirus sp.]|uniref:Uncharacterized protein n=1 Tax=Hyperionvirus sp. TaxID=2487770 RepID=A0A3G5A6Y0_9VIRU|nr:MAG: hypothetical protein Hyperionvirus3_143 [Hyperionvirus sp.]